jgi:elongation factor G
MEPMDTNAEETYEFDDQIKGGVIPNEYIPSVDKGFRMSLEKGQLIGFPVVGVRVTINDGATHPVDSSDMAFQQAAQGAFRQIYMKAKPIILEPIMKVTVEGPTEYQGNIFGSLNQRRGIILTSSEDGAFSVVEAEVPLSEMFGYSTVLRSLTQGKAEFSMEFLKYGKVPQSVAEELIRKFEEAKKQEQKQGAR